MVASRTYRQLNPVTPVPNRLLKCESPNNIDVITREARVPQERSRRFCTNPRKKSSSGIAINRKVNAHAAAGTQGGGILPCQCRKWRLNPSTIAMGTRKDRKSVV